MTNVTKTDLEEYIRDLIEQGLNPKYKIKIPREIENEAVASFTNEMGDIDCDGYTYEALTMMYMDDLNDSVYDNVELKFKIGNVEFMPSKEWHDKFVVIDLIADHEGYIEPHSYDIKDYV